MPQQLANANTVPKPYLNNGTRFVIFIIPIFPYFCFILEHTLLALHIHDQIKRKINIQMDLKKK